MKFVVFQIVSGHLSADVCTIYIYIYLSHISLSQTHTNICLLGGGAHGVNKESSYDVASPVSGCFRVTVES